jgi:hypothetical protein
MSTRWDHLLDRKALTLVDALMTEIAKQLAEELLGGWPPPVESLDAQTGAEFAAVLAPGAPRPPSAVLLEAVRLARWDLLREHDAFDDYVRNQRWRERNLDDGLRPAILFVARWLVEQTLSLGDATEGRVKRKDLVVAIDRLEKRLLPS